MGRRPFFHRIFRRVASFRLGRAFRATGERRMSKLQITAFVLVGAAWIGLGAAAFM